MHSVDLFSFLVGGVEVVGVSVVAAEENGRDRKGGESTRAGSGAERREGFSDT